MRWVRTFILGAGLVALGLTQNETASVAGSPDFGDGSDGPKTYSLSETDDPIDSSASGTAGTTSLSAMNALFGPGQRILIHQMRGAGAGNWEINQVLGYSSGTRTAMAIQILATSTMTTMDIPVQPKRTFLEGLPTPISTPAVPPRGPRTSQMPRNRQTASTR